MRRAPLSIVVASLGTGNVAHAKNDSVACHKRAFDLAKVLGHAHGLAHTCMMVLQKTSDRPLAQLLEDAAMAEQAEHNRELVNYQAAGCR